MDTALKILVVEDNDELREATLAFFRSRGHQSLGVPLAEDMNDVAGSFIPDVYVIDINLPGEDGLSLTSRLRTTHPQAGIVITTARVQIGDKVKGYDSGADVYLTKPVHPRELMAVVVAIGKRPRAAALHAPGSVVFRLARMQLVGQAGTVDLTSGEAQVLSALVRAPGLHLERWQLAAVMGAGKEDTPTPATLEMRIARLRKKLVAAGAEPPCIKAARNAGYTLFCPITMQ